MLSAEALSLALFSFSHASDLSLIGNSLKWSSLTTVFECIISSLSLLFSVMASCSFNSQHLTVVSIYLFINYLYTPSGYKIHEGRGSDYLNENCMMRS